ncbi:MAG: GNAT family N-acetyltransferase, partial [Vicinamibacterales bacterium]
TAAAFKRSIRDLQVWCSSCMVAFSGSDPIGVLIGAKRASATLIHKIAVHPDHRRQGHARHLLGSLASKLAILGPPRIVAEVPERLVPARGLFEACGYVTEAAVSDYALETVGPAPRHHGQSDRPPGAGTGGADAPVTGFVIPVTVDDLTANGVITDAAQPVCWARSLETLSARKGDIAGVALASDERIEAFVLYLEDRPEQAEIVLLGSSVGDGGARVMQLLRHLRAHGVTTLRFPKVHPTEVPSGWLQRFGFNPAGVHFLLAARARPS